MLETKVGSGSPIIPAESRSDREKIEKEVIEMAEQWMRAMGVPEDEITEHCNLELYPADLDEERKNLAAMTLMRPGMLTGAELRELAQESPPAADWFDE